MNGPIKETPWDNRIFGIDTYEITELSKNVLEKIKDKPGHFTVKLNPLQSKELLHQYGFYYCDTLIEPFCAVEHFNPSYNERVFVSSNIDIRSLTDLCYDTFQYDRFHRDFHMDHRAADERYAHWLMDIHKTGDVWALLYENDCAGFFACEKNRILLHALKAKYRGKGLAKFFWSAGCAKLFSAGYTELTSSISTANVAVLNLYSSLGFSFRNPVDVYHKLNMIQL
jgi:RimJ/RimL family protein N-acetyltransferase